MMTATFWIPIAVFLFVFFMACGIVTDVRRKKFRWRWALIAFIEIVLFGLSLWPFYVMARHREANAQWRREHPNSRRVFE